MHATCTKEMDIRDFYLYVISRLQCTLTLVSITYTSAAFNYNNYIVNCNTTKE